MKHSAVQLSILLCMVSNAATAMDLAKNMPVSVMNISKGLTNNTYDVYVQALPHWNASQPIYSGEVLIPYGITRAIGKLADIRDIRTRGNSVISCWTYNNDILNKAREEIKEKNVSEYGLRLSIIAGITGFYIAEHHWVSRDSLSNSGNKKIT